MAREIDIVEKTGMSKGTIMAAVTYVTQVLMSIMMVSMLFNSISRAMASVKRVNEVLDADPVIISGKGQQRLKSIQLDLQKCSDMLICLRKREGCY